MRHYLPRFLSAAADFPYQEESLLAKALSKFAHAITENTQSLNAHVLGGVDAEPVNVGVSNPEAIGKHQARKGGRDLAVLLLLLGPKIEGLQGEHVSFEVLRIVVPVSDVTLAAELSEVLELTRPDSSIRPRPFKPSPIPRFYAWLASTIVEPAHGVRLPVPARIVIGLAGIGIVHHITIMIVSENISRVVGNDVENHVYSMIVRSLDEVAKILTRPKMRVDIKKILNTIAVIARLERNLAKDGAYPQRTYAEAL